jgi:hypothetical protein
VKDYESTNQTREMADLRSSLQQHIRRETIPRNSLLYVDGESFLSLILTTINIQQTLLTENFYYYLHQEIISQVKSLQSLGLSLKIFFHGKQTQCKSFIKFKRFEKTKWKWENLYRLTSFSTTEDGSKKEYSQEDLPRPSLSLDQLIITLIFLNIPVYLCEGDSGPELARACKLSNDSGCSSYCYSMESDLFLMRDCPTICTLHDIEKANSKGLRASVWRRSSLAVDMRLTESQLIEASLLLGTDFTSAFSFKDYLGVPLRDRELDQICEFIQSKPTYYRLSAAHPQLEMVLRFSRDFYDLRDVSAYPFDQPDVPCFLPSSLTRTAVIRSYLGALVTVDEEGILQDYKTWPREDFPTVIFSFLRTSNPTRRCVEKNGSKAAAIIHSAVRESLSKMVEGVRSENMNSTRKEIKKLPAITDDWEDVCLEDWEGLSVDDLLQARAPPGLPDLCEDILTSETEFPAITHSWEDVVALDQFECLLQVLLRYQLHNLEEATTLKVLFDNQVLYMLSFADHFLILFQPFKIVNRVRFFQERRDASSPSQDSISTALPIDAHSDLVLSHIRQHRCTLIQGETGD